MIEELSYLIKRLSDPEFDKLNIINWGAPIITFGNLQGAKIATLGLNPSNKEFVNNNGGELVGEQRRFHTLSSLGINSWSEINNYHLELIINLCNEYFSRNPYDNWFKKLDYLISGTSMSYYFPSSSACHLDLVPYATSVKWGELSSWQKNQLLKLCSDILGNLLCKSTIKVLVLNGKSVVDSFVKISDINFTVSTMEDWHLRRKGETSILGFAYEGKCSKIGDVSLKSPIYVLGYNYNIQSSYGITTYVKESIRKWITNKTELYI